MRRLVLLVTMWLAAIGAAEAAAPSRPFRVGAWSGGPQLNSKANVFERCTATSTSKGTAITYSLDAQFRWDMSVSSAAWKFNNGTVWNVYLRIGDGADTIPARAVASAASVLDIKVDNPIDVVALLSSARQLRMIAGAAGFEFAVDGSGEVLAALTRCVLQSTRAPQHKSKPAGPLDQTLREDASALVNNIGLYGGAGDVKVVPTPDELSRLPVLVAWKSGLVTASVSVMDAPVNRVAAVLLERWQSACRDELAFVSEAATAGQAPITRIFASCITPETALSMYQFAIARPKGGVYVVSTLRPANAFADQLQRLADAYERRLRGMITIAISKLP
jgi:hypothetical protein